MTTPSFITHEAARTHTDELRAAAARSRCAARAAGRPAGEPGSDWHVLWGIARRLRVA